MARLTLPKTLEVGTITGSSHDDLFLRVFERHRGETDTARTFVCQWNGEAFTLVRRFEHQLADLAIDGEGALHVLGKHGEYDVYRGGQWAPKHAGIPGLTTQLRLLPSGTYALGWGAVHRFDGGAWTRLEVGGDEAMVFDLLEVDDALVVCGSDGLLGRLDGSGHFHPVATGTPVNLTRLTQHEGRLLVCGGRSTLLELRGDRLAPRWERDDDVDLNDLCTFDGALLVASDEGIDKVVGAHRERLHDDYTSRLGVFGDRLFRQGFDDVSVLSGDAWADFPVWLDVEREPSVKKTARKKAQR